MIKNTSTVLDHCEQPATVLSVVSGIESALKQHHDALESLISSTSLQQQALLESILSSLRTATMHQQIPRSQSRLSAMSSLASSTMEANKTCMSRDKTVGPSNPYRNSNVRAIFCSQSREFDDHDRQKRLRAKSIFVEFDDLREEAARPIGTESTLLSFIQRHTSIFINPRFDLVTAMLIFTNIIFAGVQVELKASRVGLDDAEDNLQRIMAVISTTFVVIFWVEMILRMLAEGGSFFWGHERGWNWLEVIINVLSAIEVLADALLSNVIIFAMNTKFARLLRAVRILRLVRVIRIFRVFRQLRILVLAILGALKAGAWTLVLLGVIIYAFGVAFTTAAIDAVVENPTADFSKDISKYFGSLSRSMLTLFQAICGGIDWSDAVEPLGDASTLYLVIFYFYIAFTSMIVMNAMTGIFVQSAIESAQLDSEQVLALDLADTDRYQRRLAQICDKLDSANIGFITLDSLELLLQNPEIKSYFKMLELDPTDAWSLFRVLDTKEAGALTIDEFARGCLELRGGARRVDMRNVMYISNWIMQKLARFSQSTEETLVDLFEMLNELAMKQEGIESRLARAESTERKRRSTRSFSHLSRRSAHRSTCASDLREQVSFPEISSSSVTFLENSVISLPPECHLIGVRSEAEGDQVPEMPFPRCANSSSRDDLGRISHAQCGVQSGGCVWCV